MKLRPILGKKKRLKIDIWRKSIWKTLFYFYFNVLVFIIFENICTMFYNADIIFLSDHFPLPWYHGPCSPNECLSIQHWVGHRFEASFDAFESFWYPVGTECPSSALQWWKNNEGHCFLTRNTDKQTTEFKNTNSNVKSALKLQNINFADSTAQKNVIQFLLCC